MAFTEGEKDFFKKRYTVTVAFGIAVLLFLLPFAEVNLQGWISLIRPSGIELAAGTSTFREIRNRASLQHDIPRGRKQAEKGGFSRPNYAAAISLLAGIAGFIFSLLAFRGRAIVNIVLALAGAAMLLVLLVVMKNAVDIVPEPEAEDEFSVQADFTLWYYFSFFSFLAAAFFGWKHLQLQAARVMPPETAPQVKIKKPGEQSEFPKSASESDLG